jgi:hypothetical protein
MAESFDRFMTEEQHRAQRREARLFNERLYICPDCGGQCHYMGLDFKAPKRANARAWREVEAFIRSGKVYYRGR